MEKEVAYLRKQVKELRIALLVTQVTTIVNAKDIKEATAPICNWMKENRKVISDLERLLGDVKKQEKQAQNRSYTNRTGVMKKLK